MSDQVSLRSANAASGAVAIPGPTEDGGFVYLTPETLIGFCDARLKDIDTYVGNIYRKQEELKVAGEALSDLKNEISKYNTAADTNDPHKMRLISDKFITALKAMPDGPAKSKLNDAFAAFEKARGPGDIAIRVEDTGAADNAVNTASSEVAQASQPNMVHLQHWVSQRQLALTMCSNLVSSLSEGTRTIAQNIGR